MQPEPFGKYTLVHQLATGGMGEVMLARESGPGGFHRFVAIKRLLPHLVENEQFVQMFLDEARLAARLSHPNICPIYEFGCLDGRYYLSMEYLQGESMAAVLKAARGEGPRRGLPKALVAWIVAQATEGLRYAHERTDDEGHPLKLVHRDISPSNIFVTFDGGVKLLDFGVAKAAHRITQTATGSIKGKFPYIAPEIYRGEEPDARADLFAMGAVLWEFLIGKRLFQKDTEYATCKAVVEEPAKDPRTLDPTIPDALADIVLKAVAKKVEERYQSALEMRRALGSYLKTVTEDTDGESLATFLSVLFGEVVRKRASVLDALKETTHEISGTSALEPRYDGSDSRSGSRPRPSGMGNEAPTRTVGAPRQNFIEPVGPAAPAPARRSGRRWAIAASAVVLIGAAAWGAVHFGARPAPPEPPPAPVAKVDPPPPPVIPAVDPPPPAAAPPPVVSAPRPTPPRPPGSKHAQRGKPASPGAKPAAVNPDEPLNPWDGK